MKTWQVPVQWTMEDIIEIKAETLSEAMEKAVESPFVSLDGGDYIAESLHVILEADEEYVRMHYNGGQEDD